MHISLDGFKIPLYPTCALVIGAGAAGLNCSDELAKRGVETLLAAQDFDGGTSLNAGSDKQTFHRLAPSGDSVRALAETYMAGGHMHGDTALALAAGSSAAFYKLAELGVPFPHDEYGEYVGYRTDHDDRLRATSAGPLTSRFMAQRLRERVERRGVRTLTGALVSILTGPSGACGALFFDPNAVRRGLSPLVAVSAKAVILCTGGAADLYEHTVYPPSQVGAMGAALLAGARAANLWSWQYGIASTGFRWNLSGTYQQALPRYLSATGEEILVSWMPCNPDDMIFLKGYQWPFDSRKLGGSSRVDLAVYEACYKEKGAYLNFFSPDAYKRLGALGPEAQDYLAKGGAAQTSAYERLAHMNPDAVELYRSHGIDLAREMLPIAVCAQHQNGGLSVDRWWRTSVAGLYAAGEVSGCFGAYRPGGSALNETQVGSLRAAQHIAANIHDVSDGLGDEALAQVEKEVSFLHQGASGGDDAELMHAHLRREFSLCAGPVRNVADMKALLAWADERAASRHAGETLAVLRLRDALACAQATLSSMILQAQSMPCAAGHVIADRPLRPDALPASADDRFASSFIETSLAPVGARSGIRPVRPLPTEGDRWFENVWRAYRDGDVFRG